MFSSKHAFLVLVAIANAPLPKTSAEVQEYIPLNLKELPSSQEDSSEGMILVDEDGKEAEDSQSDSSESANHVPIEDTLAKPQSWHQVAKACDGWSNDFQDVSGQDTYRFSDPHYRKVVICGFQVLGLVDRDGGLNGAVFRNKVTTAVKNKDVVDVYVKVCTKPRFKRPQDELFEAMKCMQMYSGEFEYKN